MPTSSGPLCLESDEGLMIADNVMIGECRGSHIVTKESRELRGSGLALHICVCMCICTHVCVHALMCASQRSKLVSSMIALHLSFGEKFSLNLELVISVSWSASPRNAPVSVSSVLGLQVCANMSACWDLDLGSHACTTNNLLTEPLP